MKINKMLKEITRKECEQKGLPFCSLSGFVSRTNDSFQDNTELPLKSESPTTQHHTIHQSEVQLSSFDKSDFKPNPNPIQEEIIITTEVKVSKQVPKRREGRKF